MSRLPEPVRPGLRVSLLAGVLALSACLNTTAPTIPEPEPWSGDFSFAFADPVDDTFEPGVGETGDALDVLSVEGDVTATLLTIRLTFATAVVPWSEAAANSLDGYLDIDADENGATGIPAAVDEAGGDTGLGVDYYVQLRDNGAGQMAFFQAVTQQFVLVPFEINDKTVTITVPRGLMNDGDGQFTMANVFGQGDRPVTDITPNSSHHVVHRAP